MTGYRPSGGRAEVRILFAFDPARKAILLAAGDKAGNWQKWYRTNIPPADERYGQHLDRPKRGAQCPRLLRIFCLSVLSVARP